MSFHVGGENKLQKTIQLAEQMKQDYEMLKLAHIHLKEENVRLQQGAHASRQAIHELSQKADLAVQAKTNLERECEALYGQWSSHLKQQADEFANMQNNMVSTKEMQIWKLQVTEKLEGQHRAQVDALMAEVNKYRDLYYKDHRELELLNTQYEQSTIEFTDQLQTERQRQMGTISDLTDRNQKLQALVEDSTTEDVLHNEKRCNRELLVKLKGLETELAEMRTEHQAAAVKNEEEALSHMNLCKVETGKRTILEAQLQASDRRHDVLVTEVKEHKHQQEMLAEQLRQSEGYRRELQGKLDTFRLQMRSAEDIAQHRFEEVEKKHSKQTNELQVKLSMLKEENGPLKQQVADLQTQLTEQIRNEASKVEQAREKDEQEIKALNSKLLKAADVAAGEKLAAANALSDVQAQISGLRNQISMLQAENKCQTQEMETLQRSCRELETANGMLMDDFKARVSEYEELRTEYECLQGSHRGLLETQQDMLAEQASLKRDRDLTRQENDRYKEELLNTKTTHLQTLQQHQDKWQAQAKELRTRSERKQALAEKQIAHLKESKNKYKQFCVQLKEHVLNIGSEKKKLASESTQLEQMLKKSERQRSFLQSQMMHQTADIALGGGGVGGRGTESMACFAGDEPCMTSHCYSETDEVATRGGAFGSVFSQAFLEQQKSTQDKLKLLRRTLDLKMGIDDDGGEGNVSSTIGRSGGGGNNDIDSNNSKQNNDEDYEFEEGGAEANIDDDEEVF